MLISIFIQDSVLQLKLKPISKSDILDFCNIFVDDLYISRNQSQRRTDFFYFSKSV